jgi:hypothetical protein
MPQLDVFRQTLAAKLGRVLTPEDAVEIETAFFSQPDHSHNPSKFGRLIHGGYTIQAERFSDIVAEMHELHLQHWGETEKHRHGLAMNPDYDGFTTRERAGNLIQFTMRTESGELVGNLRMFIATSMHTQTRYASEDTLFIQPQHRGGFGVMALMRFAEQSLVALGVREIRVNSKLVNKADVLMRRMGYDPVALEFVKIFRD